MHVRSDFNRVLACNFISLRPLLLVKAF